MNTRSVNKHSPKPVLPELASVVLPMKRTRVLAPCQDTAQSKQRCRTADDFRNNDLTGCKQALSEADIDGQARPAKLATEERLKRSRARLFVWEKNMRRIQAQEAPNDATTENETETVPRRQRTLSDEAARRRRLLAARMSSDVAANGMNLQQLGGSRTSDSAELRCLPPEIRDLDEPARCKGRDRRRNRRRNVRLDGRRVLERNSCELGGAVAQCLDGRQVSLVRPARCPQAAEHLEKPAGLAAVRYGWGLRAVWWSKASVLWDCCTPRRAPAYETVQSGASTSRGLAGLLDHPRGRGNRQTHKGSDVQPYTGA